LYLYCQGINDIYKGIFGGELFNKSIFSSLSSYNKLQIIMGPFYYGGGYMQIPLGTILSLTT